MKLSLTFPQAVTLVLPMTAMFLRCGAQVSYRMFPVWICLYFLMIRVGFVYLETNTQRAPLLLPSQGTHCNTSGDNLDHLAKMVSASFLH